MSDGLAALDAIIARAKRLGGMAEDVARRAAPRVDKVVKATVRAGQTPLGVTWKIKKDGELPLVRAADSIETTAQGTRILVKLTGPTVYHHLGLGGRPVRQVIPDGASVSPALEAAVLGSAREVFFDITRGAL